VPRRGGGKGDFHTDNKSIVTYASGKRFADNARRFMVDLADYTALGAGRSQ